MADAKRRKLNELDRFRRKVPHASSSALSAILREVQRNGWPELNTRKDIAEVRDDAIGTQTADGDLYITIDLDQSEGHPPSVPKLTFIHPFALLSVVLRTCVSFALIVERFFYAKPPPAEHPWHVLLYNDEVTPGNQLSSTNSRNIQSIYSSFLEFHHRLSDENVWFTIAAKRSSELKAASGGMPQLFGVSLKLFFVQEAFELNGVSFTLPSGRRIRIFAKLGFFMQDGGAHKITWYCKGYSGTNL